MLPNVVCIIGLLILDHHFARNLKVGVSYDSGGFDLDNIAPFIADVKAIWKKVNLELG